MKLGDFLEMTRCDITLRYPDIYGNWMCSIGDVCDGIMLVGVCGRGKTPNAAMQDLLPQIAGKRIKVRRYDEAIYHQVPSSLNEI